VSDANETILLGPEDEARRLWRGAVAAHEGASKDLVALCESLDLGLHAAEILAIQKLQPVKDRFPATIALQLDTPDPEVNVLRDAVAEPKALEFTDLLDLLSAEELDCVGPRLHRGWEDRRFSCRRSRETAQAALGVTLGHQDRDRLLLLAAYRNRLFRYPPPIRIDSAEVLEAFGALRSLVDHLLELGSEA
jgi:hypothetical protein